MSFEVVVFLLFCWVISGLPDIMCFGRLPWAQGALSKLGIREYVTCANPFLYFSRYVVINKYTYNVRRLLTWVFCKKHLHPPLFLFLCYAHFTHSAPGTDMT